MKPISSPSLKPLLLSFYSNKSDDDTILLPSSLDLNEYNLNDELNNYDTIDNKDKDNNNVNSDIEGIEQFNYSDDSCEFDIFDNFEEFNEEEFNFQQNNKLTEQIFINVANSLLIEE